MRNTAEKNLSAMSVKWSSKELANLRALSVIYDWEPITSSLLYLPIIWGWQVYLLFFDDQHVKFIEGQVTEAGASGSDLVSSTAPNKSFRENGSFYFLQRNIKAKTGLEDAVVNQATVWPESGADRAAASFKQEFSPVFYDIRGFQENRKLFCLIIMKDPFPKHQRNIFSFDRKNLEPLKIRGLFLSNFLFVP